MIITYDKSKGYTPGGFDIAKCCMGPKAEQLEMAEALVYNRLV